MKWIFFTFLSFCFFQIQAQKRIFSGVIQDSLQRPLEYANIMANPINSDLPFVFALTDSNGEFSLKLAPKVSYAVSISFMGFYKQTVLIDSFTTNIKKIIVLKERAQLLDEVIVVAKTPMKVTKDSIVYNVDKFVTGHEFKLKSIMKKLPGIVIKRNGTITVMGEKVTQLFVDGKPFFGGSTKLALDNLPANVVAKVEVVKDYNKVDFMQGLTDKQKMIINIKLKKGKKHFVFGDAVIGTNTSSEYLLKANMFYYSPKTNLGAINNSNDIGIQPLNNEDYRRFMSNKKSQVSTGIRRNSSNPIIKFLTNDDFLAKKIHFNSMQWQQDVGSKWSFNLFGVGSNSKTLYKRKTVNEYLFSAPVSEIIWKNNNKEQSLNFAKLSLNYKPAFNQYFDYTMQLNARRTKQIENIQKNSQVNAQLIKLDNVNSLFNLNQDFDWYRKFNKKNIVKISTSFLYTQNNPKQKWFSNNPILDNLIPLITLQSNYRIAQDTRKNDRNFDFLVKHYYKMNGRNHLYFSLGNNYTKSVFVNELIQETNTGTVSFLDFNSDYSLKIDDLYFGLQYRFKLWKSLMTPGVYWHKISWKNTYQDSFFTRGYLLPKLDFEWDPYGKITINYQLKVSLPATYKYNYATTVQNFNSLYKGNPLLTNELYHDIKFKYRFGLLKHSILFNINYKKRLKTILNKLVYNGTDSYVTTVNNNLLTNSMDVTLSYSYNHKKISFRYTPSLNLSNGFEYFGNDLYGNRTKMFFQSFNIIASPRNYPEIEFGIMYQYMKNTVVNTDTSLVVNELNPYMNLTYEFKNFVITSAYTLKQIKPLNGIKNDYHFLDFEIHYGNDNMRWGTSLAVVNMFNADAMESYSQNTYLRSHDILFKQQRTWMFKIHYRF